jgi:hypothetical protein
MPNETFDVESHTATTVQAGSTPGGAWRGIALTSPDLFHGIRNRVTIYFFERHGAKFGVVTNVDQPNYDGLMLTPSV